AACILRAGADELHWVAMHLAWMGAPNEVIDPPELLTVIERLGAWAGSVRRAAEPPEGSADGARRRARRAVGPRRSDPCGAGCEAIGRSVPAIPDWVVRTDVVARTEAVERPEAVEQAGAVEPAGGTPAVVSRFADSHIRQPSRLRRRTGQSGPGISRRWRCRAERMLPNGRRHPCGHYTPAVAAPLRSLHTRG